MDQILKMAADAGMTKDQGEAATGGIFSMIKKTLDSGDFSKITSKVPEIDDLVNKHEAGAASGGGGGGMFGSAMSKLGGAGGGAGGLPELFASLSKQGIGTQEVNKFMPQLASFTKESCGVDIGSILGVPATSAGGAGDAAGSMNEQASAALGNAMGMFGK